MCKSIEHPGRPRTRINVFIFGRYASQAMENRYKNKLIRAKAPESAAFDLKHNVTLPIMKNIRGVGI